MCRPPPPESLAAASFRREDRDKTLNTAQMLAALGFLKYLYAYICTSVYVHLCVERKGDGERRRENKTRVIEKEGGGTAEERRDREEEGEKLRGRVGRCV